MNSIRLFPSSLHLINICTTCNPSSSSLLSTFLSLCILWQLFLFSSRTQMSLLPFTPSSASPLLLFTLLILQIIHLLRQSSVSNCMKCPVLLNSSLFSYRNLSFPWGSTSCQKRTSIPPHECFIKLSRIALPFEGISTHTISVLSFSFLDHTFETILFGSSNLHEEKTRRDGRCYTPVIPLPFPSILALLYLLPQP